MSASSRNASKQNYVRGDIVLNGEKSARLVFSSGEPLKPNRQNSDGYVTIVSMLGSVSTKNGTEGGVVMGESPSDVTLVLESTFSCTSEVTIKDISLQMDLAASDLVCPVEVGVDTTWTKSTSAFRFSRKLFER